MPSLNQIQLIGRVGREPEVRSFPNGNSVCNFTLATSEIYTDNQGQRQEETEWFNVQLPTQLAKMAQYFHKGSLLYIGGKVKTRKWTDQQGQEHQMTVIVCLTLQLLDPKPVTNDSLPPVQNQYAQQQPAQAPVMRQSVPPVPPVPPVPQVPQAPAAPQYRPPQGGGNDDLPW